MKMADSGENNFYTKDYIENTLQFLATYRTLYDFKLTDFLKDKAWEKLPVQVIHHDAIKFDIPNLF